MRPWVQFVPSWNVAMLHAWSNVLWLFQLYQRSKGTYIAFTCFVESCTCVWCSVMDVRSMYCPIFTYSSQKILRSSAWTWCPSLCRLPRKPDTNWPPKLPGLTRHYCTYRRITEPSTCNCLFRHEIVPMLLNLRKFGKYLLRGNNCLWLFQTPRFFFPPAVKWRWPLKLCDDDLWRPISSRVMNTKLWLRSQSTRLCKIYLLIP